MAESQEALRELLKDAAELNASSPLVAKIALLVARSHLIQIASASDQPDPEVIKALEHVDAAIDVMSAAVDKALAAEYAADSTPPAGKST